MITLTAVPKKGEPAQPAVAGENLAELVGLQYPVPDHDTLIAAMSPCRKYFVRGAEVDTQKIAELPAWIFPLISPGDLEIKLQKRVRPVVPVAYSTPVPQTTHVPAPISEKGPS